jgi:very-short-patch-repair endonuclease
MSDPDAGPTQARTPSPQSPAEPPPPPAPPQLRLTLTLDPCVNYAAQQNGVAPLKELALHNLGAEEVRDIVVRLRAEPEFVKPLELRIDALAAGGAHVLSAPGLALSAGFLAGLNERLRGALHVEVLAGGVAALAEEHEIAVLAYDQWGGARVLPELLSAFVLPNHPVVARWLGEASALLERWTQDPALSGYQSLSRERVAKTAAAVFHALQSAGIAYINPPASFEHDGQKVRTPDRIAEERLGTCLDLALAAAACLEQAGLHALVVLVKEHAFCGVWLDEQSFLDPTLEDGALFTKRVELGEILVFDPTLASTRPQPGFEAAVQAARERLADPAEFGFVVDVARSRRGGVRPLPLRAHGIDASADDEAAPSPSESEPTLHLPGRASAGDAVETPADRIERWKRRLLDLTARNRLLNFKSTKKTLPIAFAAPGEVEDQLAEGRTLSVRPRLAEMRDACASGRALDAGALRQLARDELRAGRLLTNLGEDELDVRLTEIFRAAREGLEEGGASGLYLALGFLEWFESPTADAPRRAPLVLLPVNVDRTSVRQGFRVTRGADETRFNTTLLEMLRVVHKLDIAGLEPLPEDEKGVDIDAVLQSVRRAIRDVPRWRVVEEVQMGFFTFAKFLMWKDLDSQADVLLRNRVVAHLVHEAGAAFDPQWRELSGGELDDGRSSEVFCPVLADSSQLAAVLTAASGKSFVLEGPPGTGKSQTITNLIAHCLANGKTVLFVSEKTAALDVVFKRLKGIGLERFCLELHSNKASKLKVVQELGSALNAAQTQAPDAWTATSDELDRVRGELNAYARAAAQVHASGLSAFRAASMLTSLRDAASIPLDAPGIEALDRAAVDRLRADLRDAESSLRAVGEPFGHPLTGVTLEDAPQGFQERAHQVFVSLRTALAALLAGASDPARSLGVDDLLAASAGELARLAAALAAAVKAPARGARLLLSSAADAQRIVQAVTTHGRRRDALRTQLSKRFDLRLLELDLLALRGQVRQASSSWWFSRWLQTRALRRTFAAVAQGSAGLELASMGEAIERALELRDLEAQLARETAELGAAVGETWSAADSPWDELETLLTWTERTRLELRSPAIERRLVEWIAAAGGAANLRDVAVATLARLDAAELAGGRVAEFLGFASDDPWLSKEAPAHFGAWRARVDRIEPALVHLRAWALWRRFRRRLVDGGLHALVAALEAGRVRSPQLLRTFERSYHEAWLESARRANPVLRDFMGSAHDLKIERFRELDERWRELSKRVVAARLSAAAPSRQGAAAVPGSELGVLQRQVQLQRRHMGLRQLFQQTRTLVQRLKPCFLMSPISVAQYLPPGQMTFDLVVFDEASQIPTWDAVGAIARGAQAVIVGDSKQLPPTSFFDAVIDEDEHDDGAFEELESILEECRAAGVPPLDLRWHYRSRHESLIAFSNRKYYDNRLQTFPSALAAGMGVQWRPVAGGVYDKGRSRTNRGEARALVDEVLRRLRDPELARHSIGVVTFSAAQQGLVEDLLDAERRADPALDAHFVASAERSEPVFVKNLENVQGDERDVILFSICYGPDEEGRVAMNFGPLNQQGGQRRLNVAVTRARRELIVFSTLTADQIDLSRTRARGVADLRTFLAYAQHGVEVLPAEAVAAEDDDFESPLENELAAALRARGYEVRTQIGCSGYRIDLAVVHPDVPGRFLVGIECDGRNYHSARTARDRDRLRQGVLEGLGWKLLRVWSSDWWDEPEVQLERLQRAIEELRAASPATELPPSAPSATASLDPAREKSVSLDPTPAATASTDPTSAVKEATDSALDPTNGGANAAPSSVAESSPAHPRYVARRIAVRGEQADFYDETQRALVAATLREVVESEGPLRLELAAARVAAAFGFARTRQAAVDRIEGLARGAEIQRTQHGERVFLWPAAQPPDEWRGFRTCAPDDPDARDAIDLPPEELANAALHLLATNGACPRRDLQRALARLCGFKSLGATLAGFLDEGIELLLRSGRARLGENERVEPC